MPASAPLAAVVAATIVLAVTACSGSSAFPSTTTAPGNGQPQSSGTQPAPVPEDGGLEEAATPETRTQEDIAVPPAQPGERATGDPKPQGFDAGALLTLDPGVPGLPEASGASIDDVLRLGAVATWIERPTRIGLSLPASDACAPAMAGDPYTETETQIAVEFTVQGECQSPNAARTYTIEVPDDIDTSGIVTLSVQGLDARFTLTLPAE